MHNKLEGKYEKWYDNGQNKIVCTYLHGNKEGKYEEWHANGQKEIECTYLRDQKEGKYEKWFDHGEKEIECTYIHDKLHEKVEAPTEAIQTQPNPPLVSDGHRCCGKRKPPERCKMHWRRGGNA